ncbi:EI24 domain-containing protein [Demequina sp. SO4-13]|uniref:EI24 domain-containing protein n=1 Tax=Demequina sp. SO4-13 TaxID=3401027 RepID=UPI003AF566F6
MAPRTPSPRIRPVREAAFGAATAWRGLRTWSTSPRLMAWGLLPGAITAVLFGGAAIAIALQIAEWSSWLAALVVSEDGAAHGALQIVAALAVVAASVLVAVYAFTAVTLTIGQPFFERIGRAVDERHGFTGAEPDEQWARALLRSVGEAVRLAALTLPFAAGLFLVGLIPVIGGITAFVLGATIGGWFLALELTAYPLARRGHVSLAARRAVLRQHRPRVVGFGAAVFVLFLIPLGAALFMPAAVAGAALLVNGPEFVARAQPDDVTTHRGERPPGAER